MNKIYRIVFNRSIGRWVVASEMAKGRTKAARAGAAGTALVVVTALGLMSQAHAGTPIGGGVTTSGIAIDANNGGCGAGNPSGFNGPATASGGFSPIAIGCSTQANGDAAIAIGTYSTATGTAATALGDQAWASGNNAIALGRSAAAKADGASALGVGASATGTSSVAIGPSASATALNAIALGNAAVASGTTSIAMGAGSSATVAGSVAIGQNAVSDGADSISLGHNAKHSVGANNSIAIGGDSIGGDKSVSLGNSADTSGSQWAVAVGHTAKASGQLATAIGGAANASGANATTVGVNSVASASNSVALGNAANASATNSVALGTGSTTTATLTSAAYNPGSAALSGTASTAKGEVSIGASGFERRLTNLAAGSAATDAVNVSQLQAQDATVDKQGADLAARLGGGSTYTATTGAVSAPSYTLANANAIGGTTGAATDVGSGFAKVDSALGTVNTTVTNISNGGGIKFFHTNSTKADSSATAVDAIAVGGAAVASGMNSIAMGSGSSATVAGAIAIGQNAASDSAASISIGQNAKHSVGANHSVAIGGDSVGGENSVSLGAGATTSASQWAVAVGANAIGSGQLATAIGGAAKASGTNATTVGVNSVASATDSVALGNAANASATNSVALGAGSTTTATLTSTGYNPGSAALSGTASTAKGEVSIGASGFERRLTNLAAGSAATDAVNVSQLQAQDATVDKQGADLAARLGGGSTYTATTGAVSAPGYTLANANAIGGTTGAATDVGAGFAKVDTALGALNATANKGFNVSADAGATSQNIAPGGTVKYAAGSNATVSRSGDTITYGMVANPTFTGTVTANGGLTVGASQAVNMGGNKVTNVAAGTAATDAVNKSQLDTATATLSSTPVTFTGNDATAGVVNRKLGETLAIKGAASTTGTYSGANLKTVTDPTTGAINLQMAESPKFGAVTLNDAGSGKITGVTDGTLASGSKDAVNGGQLYSTNQAVAGNTTNISSLQTTVNNISSGTAGLVQQSAAGQKLTVGSSTDGAEVDFAGTAGARKLTNVADGTLAATSKDAVNGGQLYTTNQNVTQNTSDITSLGDRVTVNEGDISSLQTSVTNINSGTAGLVQQSAAGQNLTVGKDTDGTEVDFAGTAGARKLTNVADGTLAAGSKDAVNGGQLYATNQNVTQNTSDITSLGNRVTVNEGDISSLQTSVTNINSGTAGLVQQSAAGQKLTVGSSTDGAEVDFAGTTGARKLTNVADGTLAAGSKDGVNGSQLHATNQNVTALGDRVTVNEGDISSLQTSVTNINSGTAGLVQQSAAGQNLTVGKDTDGTEVDFAGTAGARKLTNVADGTLAAGSKDAVNGGQLYATNQNVTQNTSDITSLGNRVTVNEGDISSLQTSVTNINSGTAGLVQQSAAGQKLTVGSSTDGAEVDFAGTTGARKLTNVADGTLAAGSKDGVNGSQLHATNQNVTALGDRVTVNEGDISSLQTSVTNINSGTAGLVQQSAAGQNLTVGKDTDGTEVDFAGTAGARKLTSVADGTLAAGSKDAVNGGQLYATNQNVTQNTSDITSLGDRVTVNEGDISSLQTSVTNINSGTSGLVQYDDASGLVTVAKDKAGAAVDFRGTAGARRLKGVAAGGENEDAVNVSQLKQVTNALGGGAGVNADGTVTGPTYHVTNADGSQSTVTNAGDAITNIDGRVYQNTTSITNLTTQINSGTVGLVQQSAAGQKLTVGKGTDGTEVDFADKDGNARKLTQVADGKVEAGSKDAVNGGQLHGVAQSMATAIGGGSVVNNDGTISAPHYAVTKDDGSTATVAGVEGAINNLDGRVYHNTQAIAGNTTAINNLTQQMNSGEVGLVKQDATTRAITVAKDNDGASVSFAGTAGDRTLSGVAAGKADNDAVNVGQLKAAGIVDGDGQAKALVAYDNASKSSVTMGGVGATAPVAIHNVAEGVADRDAVNVAQLNDRLARSNTEVVRQANAYTDQRIDDVWGGMNELGRELVNQDRRISQVGAMAMAESQMTANAAASSVGNPAGAIAMGVGSHNGYVALSAGYAKPIGKKSRISFGAAISGHDQSIGLGFGHSL